MEECKEAVESAVANRRIPLQLREPERADDENNLRKSSVKCLDLKESACYNHVNRR